MSVLRDFLETLRNDDLEGTDPPWGDVPAKVALTQPWLAWAATCDRVRQVLARAERAVGRELEKFLAGLQRDEGDYRVELELDGVGEGQQLLRFAQRLLEELRARHEESQAGV